MSDDELFRVESFTPEEMGWQRIGERTWEKPNGQHHLFPPDGPELIEKLVSPIPKYKPGDA